MSELTRFVRFIVAGSIAATVSFTTRIIFDIWVSYAVAITLAYLAGMITAFTLMRSHVFPPGRHTILRSAMFFTLVNIAGLAQTLGVSLLLSHYLLPAIGVQRFSNEIAHMIGIAVPTFTSYVGHKSWSFE